MFSSNTSQVSSNALFIEDVMSTFLYAGTGPSAGQTITNNIDLSTEGGMTWIKNRTDAGTYPTIIDTVRGATKELYTNQAVAQSTVSNGLTAFTSSGFTLGTDTAGGNVNYAYSSPSNFVSWTFRKAPKFFDVVTYTGNGTSGRQIAHNLGSEPGCIIVKCTSEASAWAVYHRSLTGTNWVRLNTTDASAANSTIWNNTNPTSTVFTVGNAQATNQNTSTYVAYLFAHNAGGFGLTGTDNVISCGSYTGNGSGSGPTVTLGYEPQWLLIKRTDSTSNWTLIDNMRGIPTGSDAARLFPNLSDAEITNQETANLLATGFKIATADAPVNASGGTYIYIAIRRGPMKVPESGTSVFAPALGVSTTPNMVAGFPVDSFLGGDRNTPTSSNWKWWDRLRGNVASLLTTTTAAEATDEFNYGQFQSMTGFISGNYDASDKIGWNFRRAPGFFDEVCYTGTGSAGATQSHNLGVAPEMWIVKRRSTADSWVVGTSARGSNVVELDLADGEYNAGTAYFSNGSVYTAPTSSVIWLGSNARVNQNGGTFVAYLFASCPGVSKVGSYTGTGTTQTINCGFTAGSRFVLIKRTDSTGDWYVWDSARGIVAGNDPYLLLNSTAAEVTSTDYIDTYSAGFEISSTAPAAINASGGTFLFLAIA